MTDSGPAEKMGLTEEIRSGIYDPRSYAKPVDERRYCCTILITRFFSVAYFLSFFSLLYNIIHKHIHISSRKDLNGSPFNFSYP